MRFRAAVALRIAIILPFLLPLVPFGPALAAGPVPQLLKSGEILRGHFVQDRQLAGFAKPLRTEGTFVLVPGRGLIWRALTPFQNNTVITPEGIFGQANGQETMRLPASRMPGLARLYDVIGGALSGNIAPLEQTFAVARSEVAGGWQLSLTPLHPDNLAVSGIKSLVVTGSRFVETIEIDKGGGDVDRLRFVDQTAAVAPLSSDETRLLGALHK
jgi:hypothetical protein